jgi:hypothetical protein
MEHPGQYSSVKYLPGRFMCMFRKGGNSLHEHPERHKRRDSFFFNELFRFARYDASDDQNI